MGLPPPIFGRTRTRIREDLKRFLREARRSQKDFAVLINAEYGLDINEGTVRRFTDLSAPHVDDEIIRHFGMYLDKYVRSEFEDGPRPGADMGEIARSFFEMGTHKVRQFHHATPGIFRFYAYSESDRGRSAVCVGAIKFNEDYSVEETQTAKSPTRGTLEEIFEGTYLYRGSCLIALLRNREGKDPKFYVLSIPPYNSAGKKATLTGLLVKIGVEQPLFGTTIHMIRDDDAFGKTNVVGRDEVDEDIIQILDNRQWGPKSL